MASPTQPAGKFKDHDVLISRKSMEAPIRFFKKDGTYVDLGSALAPKFYNVLKRSEVDSFQYLSSNNLIVFRIDGVLFNGIRTFTSDGKKYIEKFDQNIGSGLILGEMSNVRIYLFGDFNTMDFEGDF